MERKFKFSWLKAGERLIPLYEQICWAFRSEYKENCDIFMTAEELARCVYRMTGKLYTPERINRAFDLFCDGRLAMTQHENIRIYHKPFPPFPIALDEPTKAEMWLSKQEVEPSDWQRSYRTWPDTI